MKRTDALAEIKWCGWHETTGRAVLIAAQKGIGKAAATKAYRDGGKMKARGEPCGCADCTKKRSK
jgi:hypothetical protein